MSSDRIIASSEWLGANARRLQTVSDAIRRAEGILRSVDTSEASGGNLAVNIQVNVDQRGFSGSTVSQAVRSLTSASTAVAQSAGRQSDAMVSVSELMEDIESMLSQRIAGIGTGNDVDVFGGGGGGSQSTITSYIKYKDSFFWKYISGDLTEERRAYYDKIIDRANHAVDPETKALYEKYMRRVKIGSEDVADGAYYSPSENKVYINWQEDNNNSRGDCSTYFHEVGHMIDDYTAFFGDSSSSKAFSNALKNDFDNYVSNVMTENNCSKDEAYRIISKWLRQDGSNKECLSDLCGAFTNNECMGNYYHESDYWTAQEHGIPEKLNNEAFAEFFEAGMSTDSAKVNYIKQMFPNAYKEFKKIVRANI